ncbi:hypothetical protein QJS10_CPA06g02481 [Acorus calamus]|uniref:Nudix hydrolase domain-containing protein n=1 Tax=Acorus calamus TaxID=4465 RepID=A0AAV9EN24_ACOCL|nr:hypothetical protein QJS10_CPA06g02481 [Acorus calamus]
MVVIIPLEVHKNLVIVTRITRLRRLDFPGGFDKEDDERELNEAVWAGRLGVEGGS